MTAYALGVTRGYYTPDELRRIREMNPHMEVVEIDPPTATNGTSFTVTVDVTTNLPRRLIPEPERQRAQWKNERQPWSRR